MTNDTLVVKNGRQAQKLTSGRYDLGAANPIDADWESVIDLATD